MDKRDKRRSENAYLVVQEKEAIVDTAETLGKSSRTPTLISFIPIGHIALELYPERQEQYSLPESTVWIKSLYISW